LAVSDRALGLGFSYAPDEDLAMFTGLTNNTSNAPIVYPVRVLEDPHCRLFNDDGKLVMCSAPPWFDFVIAHPDVAPMIRAGYVRLSLFGVVTTVERLALFSPAGGRAARNIAACYRPDGVA
jgi:hypothetical protein